MLPKGPTGGQEAIRIFNKVVVSLLRRLFRIGWINKLRRKITQISVTVPHKATDPRDQLSLEERLRRRITELLAELEAKASFVIKARRNTVEIKIALVNDDELPDPPTDEDANPVSG